MLNIGVTRITRYRSCGFNLNKNHNIEDQGTYRCARLYSVEVGYLICNKWTYTLFSAELDSGYKWITAATGLAHNKYITVTAV